MTGNVSIQISSTNNSNGKTVTDKITYINPEASNKDLNKFALALTRLTTNTYKGLTKITTEDITDFDADE